jgi:hypothetical protein
VRVIDSEGAFGNTTTTVPGPVPPAFSVPPTDCPANPSTPARILGLPLLVGYAVIAGILVAGAIGASIGLWSRRKGPGAGEPRPPSP